MPSEGSSASWNGSAAREPPLTASEGDERAQDRPEIDEWDLVYWRSERSVLSRTEAKLFRVLLDSFGRLVPHQDLIKSAWEADDADAQARQNLTTAVFRLRKRLRRLGLGIETIRGRGYILEPFPTPVAPPRRRQRSQRGRRVAPESESVGEQRVSDDELEAMQRRILDS